MLPQQTGQLFPIGVGEKIRLESVSGAGGLGESHCWQTRAAASLKSLGGSITLHPVVMPTELCTLLLQLEKSYL